jgi:PKD repeat protein
MKSKLYSFLFAFLFISNLINAQNFPRQMQLSGDGRMLQTGSRPNSPFYNQNTIPVLYLNFSDTANFWDDMIAYHDSLKDYPATLVYNGVTYDSVGVRFKGNSSYDDIGNSLKKSFNISLNAFIDGQDINGYNTLNLNNCFDDPSFMREVYFETQIKQHVPAAQTNFAQLYINGVSWGLYANVQQLNKDFHKEWFLSNDGANFRSARPVGSTGSGTIIKASFLNLGQDTTEYQKYYTLKSSEVIDPWTKLKDFCNALDTIAPSRKVAELSKHLDIDRALWFLASEIAFNDFDSYIEKGKNDFYVYYEKETGRFAPIEFDGNDVMDTHYVNAVSALRHQTDTLYPLMSKIIGVPEIRQRYLAHMRTLVADEHDTISAFPIIDSYYALIDSVVQADTIKLYSYAAFQGSPEEFKYYIRKRRLKMLNNSEVDEPSPTISGVTLYSDSVAWKQPEANSPVQIRTKIVSGDGINNVQLHSATGLVGNFTKTQMFDDGLHNDSLAGDGIFGATLPPQPGGTWVRYYIAAASNNSERTVSFDPPGAEHNIYIYLVKPAVAADSTTLVINEIMARNNSTVTDSAGQYEDWLELYNTSNQAIDISGYYLTDNEFNLTKWQIPAGTILNANDYLIIWADEDPSQGKFHANFKFSANGEYLILLNPAGEQMSRVSFNTQSPDISFARLPNGFGNFSPQFPSFGINNNPPPQVGFFTTSTGGCGSTTTSFFNTTTNATSYTWNFGDGSAPSNDVNPIHTYTAVGTYTVTLEASGGGWSVSDSLQNIVQVLAVPSISFPSDSIIATTLTYNLMGPSGFASYLWNTGASVSNLNIDSTGNYCLIVTDQNSCQDTACVYVSVVLAPQASFTADVTSACGTLTVNFSSTSVNATNFTWDFGDSSAQSNLPNPTHTYASPGIYSVSLVATNSASADTASQQNLIQVFANPVFAFSSDTLHAPGATYFLNADSGYVSYLWNTLEITQGIIIDSNGTYCVVVATSNACTDTACIYVTVNGLGISKVLNESKLNVYPNPADNSVILVSTSNKAQNFEILNSLGELVLSSQFTKQTEIATANFANGIYLIRTQNSLLKFVVKH